VTARRSLRLATYRPGMRVIGAVVVGLVSMFALSGCLLVFWN
jgi:hypothetical protein